MRYASVCSGVEAASLAWMPLGWEAVFFAEIEPFPCAVLKERFPDVPNLGDMTEIKGEKYHGTVDLLVGGTPCQSFSVAGKQAGLRGVSGLALTYCELLASMRPHWFVWENVPGVFSTNGGEDFKTLLRTFDEIGYSVAWRVLDAQYVRVDGFPRAVPQRRRRVFVVGHLGGDWRYPASVLFEPGCLPGNTPPRRVKGEGVATGAKGSIGETGAGVARSFAQSTRTTGSGVFWNGNDYAETLKANCDCDRMPDKGRLNCVIDIRTATGQENAETATDCCVNLTCNHEAPIVCAGFSGGQGEKAGGIGYQEEVAPTIRSAESGSNQVPDVICQYGDVAGSLTARHDSSPCADRGMNILCYENHDAPIAFRWAASPTQGLPIGVDYCHTLMANRNGEPAVCYENHAQDSRIKPCGECSPQINAKAGTGGCNLPLVQECFPVNSMIIGKNMKVGDRQTTGIGNAGDPLPAISSAHHHAVAIAENIIGRKENNGGNGTGAQVELAYTQNATGVMGVCYTTQGENQNADAEKARAVKILRLLRDEIGEKAFCEWTLGRLGSFQAEKVLQPNLHGESVRREAGEEKTRLDDSALSCAKNNAKNALRCLWEQFQLGHPSQGQELAQQFTAELNLRLSQLPHEIASVATVRRLLPIETERLMGFPDNHTRIPWRGKPEEECPDAPRYKACGNSMCVNVMRWIGMRIEKVERRMKGIDNEKARP